MRKEYHVHPDIRKAETLPGAFYQDAEVFERMKEAIFARSWQWVGDRSLVPLSGHVFPFFLLEKYLDEPMLLVRTPEERVRCLSNVCTHRGNILVHHPGNVRRLLCQYHGRRFDLDGTFRFMPEFEEAENFPRPCDHLHSYPLEQLGPFLFTSLKPAFSLEKVLEKMKERLGFLPLEEFRFASSFSKDYLVNAHWALYCDNYLEGFHIPFVHQELNEALDYGEYETLLDDYFNLQIGYASSRGEAFDLPQGHPDHGKEVAAYYYWIFPNLMFNFYPWGLSVNVVKPLSLNQTRVSFLTYIYDEEKYAQGAPELIDKVEREDEFVVEGVQRGLRSRAYSTGRFSPAREQGVHHFQRLLVQFLKEA
jgi:choline monooxygenase